MNPLGEIMARRIRATGPLTVAEFMAEALSHPTYGYYTTRDPFGVAGDFITAPEISQIFGELIGLWCADCWDRMGRPDPVLLVELGPGRGTLMSDALRVAKALPGFREAIRLHLVETSPTLRKIQAERLSGNSPIWHDDIGSLPEGPMFLIANEFLDALPIRQYQRGPQGWHERRVGLDETGGLAFKLDAQPSLPSHLKAGFLEDLWEICSPALAVVGEIGERLNRHPGAALFIDYGYFPDGVGDTLQAVRSHRPQGVLEAPGEADLTAHVDFASVAVAAVRAGAESHGPVTQGEFLSRLGAAQRAAKLLERANPRQAKDIESACRRLIAPDEMGTLFKVLALTHPGFSAPAGFTA